MSRDQLTIEQNIKKSRLDLLYERSKTASLTLLIANTIYVILLSNTFAWQLLLVWYLIFIVVLTGRWILIRSYNTAKAGAIPYYVWLNLFRGGILSVGLTIGSLNLFFFPFEPLSHLFLAVFFPCAIVAGAVTILLDYLSFVFYVITMMVPIVYQTVLVGEGIYAGTGVLMVVLIIFFLRFSKDYNNNFSITTKLRYENKALVDELQQEKNKLNNRLGRILNDSLNELYIVDLESLNCLQVNKGALQNLGYTEQEITSLSLLDIIVDLCRTKISKLIEPLRLGINDFVTYKTQLKRSDGSTYPAELRFQLSTQEDPPVLVISALDISERNEAERKLLQQANYDQLTKLPNRYYILSKIESAFARARRQHTKVSLLFLDLNNFKDINDTLGHGVGDKLLKQVADRILSLLREVDTPARLGGDEFLVMLEGLQEQDQAEVVVHKLLNSFNSPFFIDSNEIYTSVSIGIGTYPDDGDSVELVMQYADTAMYHAKQSSSCNYCFFSLELRTHIDEQLAIENRLRHAIRKNELTVFYQPKLNTYNAQIVGAEALLRWQNPDLGNVPPAVFIPVAEKYGLIEEIGAWVLKTACKEANDWRNISSTPLQIAVNISPRQFRSNDFLSVVDKVLQESGLPEQLLEIEITESLLMQDTKEPLEILNALRARKIDLSLDDFGTGYSSLSYLKRFPLQVIKIDRSFIHDMMENQYNMSLVDAIIAMAQILDLRLVAEGVETKEQLSFLRDRKVEIVQGYLFSPPIPAKEFRGLIKQTSAVGMPLSA
jgi:diguanylate cyclase (GGDEF)-like protein/PAS domain S-box-containing protein